MIKRLISSAILFVCFAIPAAAQKNAEPQMTMGPKSLGLAGETAKFNLPQGWGFIGPNETRALLRAQGDEHPDDAVGAVVEPANEDWTAILTYYASGYVKDDDAGKMNADSILKDMRDGTEQMNEKRRETGASEIEVVGWFKEPQYDRGTHTLSWAIIGKEKGTGQEFLNDTAIVFGRFGIMDCTVIGDKPKAEMLHAKLLKVSGLITYPQGKDYASFRSGDKISDITMTGLVTGGAAAAAYGAVKLGLMAKLGKFLIVALLAMKKAIILVIAAVAGIGKAIWAKITGRKEQVASAGGPTIPSS